MAKTLGKLRQQTLKLRELQAPSDTSKGAKAFVKKHVYTVHPDANENDDDVFKATNVKKYKRSPDHGYEPGQDAAVYEQIGGYSDIDIKRKDLRKAAARAFRSAPVANDDGFKQHEKPQWDDANDRVKAGTRASSRKGLAITSTARALRRKIVNSYEPEGNNLDEIFGKRDKSFDNFGEHPILARMPKGFPGRPGKYTPNEHDGNRAARLARQAEKRAGPKDTTGYWKGTKGTLELGQDDQVPAQREWMKNHPANKKIAGRLAPRPNVRLNPVFRDDLARMQDRKRNLETQSYEYERTMRESSIADDESVEDRNNEHHYVHGMIDDHIDQLRKHLYAHVSLMDKMNDAHHDRNFGKLMNVHDAIDSLSDKVYTMHQNAKKAMGMHPADSKPVTKDTAGAPMLGSPFAKYSEGYEHIEDLSESDQALLVDTYNNLSEENQERFLELAETQEGVDKLLDFAITNKRSA